MDISLRQLEVFARVARAGSFTQAASEMMVSQPVLSRTIRDLERALRTRLLDRTTRSVRPTADGRELLAVAEAVLESYQAGMRRFAAYRDGERGILILAALPAVAVSVLPDAISRFLDRHPDIQVKVMDGTSSEVIEHVLAGRADVALTEAADAPEELSVLPLLHDPLVAVLPPGTASPPGRSSLGTSSPPSPSSRSLTEAACAALLTLGLPSPRHAPPGSSRPSQSAPPQG
jgi:LysR family carnitine catabolism transcriptional activator